MRRRIQPAPGGGAFSYTCDAEYSLRRVKGRRRLKWKNDNAGTQFLNLNPFVIPDTVREACSRRASWTFEYICNKFFMT
jgi:hypothetical protein